MRQARIILPIVSAAAAVILTACGGGGGGTPSQSSSQAPSGAATMGNPAAAYCAEKGGTVDLASGVCTLPDGTKIDEWELYDRDHPGASGDSDSDSNG